MANNIVIKVENLSKQYRLGVVSSGTLADDLNLAWSKLRGKENPLLKIGDVNDRSKVGESDYVWSLKDINFEVKQGEVLGIIGRNGAGKSTLLKILSKVTTPTTGKVKTKGRIASLLEVGTGFHPELTGRENIFLNGAILGMTKREIRSKFDEIVAFSGVEKYIDTPVKRYSSGMYVRLAFAVAAHLEPEILIVDEVLAVGDAEFQKKCLGKMKDVSNQGRTVLFVSHNMDAIISLTENSILMNNGSVHAIGLTTDVVNEYYKLNNNNNSSIYFAKNEINELPCIRKIQLKTTFENNIHKCFQELNIEIWLQNKININTICLSVHIVDEKGISVIHSGTNSNDIQFCQTRGEFKLNCSFPKLKLFMGLYYLNVYLAEPPGGRTFEILEMVCPFEVKMFDYPQEMFEWNKESRKYLEEYQWSLKNQ
jgi:lipopolysaccharide transport system ATP-binding protein